jgi:hypothetical protein
MWRVPSCRWLLGSLALFIAGIASLLVPAIQDARNAAKKSNDK